MLYNLRKKDEAHVEFEKFKPIWEKYKKKKNPLLKCLFKLYKSNSIENSFYLF